MMRRLPVALTGAPLVVGIGARAFSSDYGSSVGKMKPSHSFNSRSAAHRHPPRQTTWKSKDTPAAESDAEPAKATHAYDEDEEPVTDVPRRVKSRYQSYFESRSEPMTFTRTFAPASSPKGDAVYAAHPQETSLDAGADQLEDAVTKIYSSDEVTQLRRTAPSASREATRDDDMPRAVSDPDVDGADDEPTDHALEDAGEDDAFAAVRRHPFFNDLVRRTETNMSRYRKEVRATGRYGRGMMDDCIRPLLQLVDYPFTPAKLSELVHSVSPVTLRNSLKELTNCQRLHVYHSKDTDVVLDWTVEDFLRRRYESIHVSWEPLEVVRKRYGWSEDVLTDRDCLLYFSQFTDFVELAELRVTNKGNTKAVPIENPVALAQSGEAIPPSSRLLIRRVAQAETEPSVTETIRLMGTPAMARAATNSIRGNRGPQYGSSRRHNNPSTVADVFDAAEDAAAEVEGDEEAKLQHAANTVKPLRQASHPSGRVIKEFSLGRRLTPEETADAMEPTSKPTSAASESAGKDDAETGNFDTASYEALAAAYHKAKVESSVLRRQLLSTDNMEMVTRLESKLAGCRKEMRRLEGLLMSTIHQGHSPVDLSPEGTDTTAPPADQDNEDADAGNKDSGRVAAGAAFGFRLPKNLPQYTEAPEFDSAPPKNRYGAVEPDLDEDEIERAIHDFDAEMSGLPPKTAPARTSVYRAQPAPSRYHKAAEKEDAAEDELDANDIEGDDTVAAVEDEQDTHASAGRVEETAEYKTMLREKKAHEERMAKMAAQLAKMEKRLAEAAAAEKRAAEEKAMRVMEAKRVAEAKREAEAKRVAEAKREAEAKRVAEAKREAEAKRVAEAKREAEAKRVAEAKARAELEAERQAALEARRERARLSEIAARKAAAQRRKAEEEALALEAELEKKLAEVRAKLHRASAAADGEDDAAIPESTEAVEAADEAADEPTLDAEEEDTPDTLTAVQDDEAVPQASEVTASTDATTPPTTNGFTCTPEQYDGLQLAATRLRREIAVLERQMEEEGDEDDETLMTVLAESRADLEELDECIHSVQSNETWAAERDAARRAEEKRQSAQEDSEFHRVQRAVDEQRFTIDLLKRRIQHATSRSVASALEQRVVQARRDVARLRITQDRLLREGRDAFGLPQGVSMAKSLAGELKDSEAKALAEEVQRAAAGLPPSKLSTETQSTSHDVGEAVEEDVDSIDADVEVPRAVTGDEPETMTTHSDTHARHHQRSTATEPIVVPKIVQENPEMRQLRQRLDGILRSIQNVQEGLLRMRDAPAVYDEEEEEAALADMKDKLGQLLGLRDDILSRLKESANASASEDVADVADTAVEDIRGHSLPLLRSSAPDRNAAADALAAPKSHGVVGMVEQRTGYQSAHQKINAAASRARRGRK